MPNRITLRGCAPEPLIHYLKALGVLRLVAEQLDPDVRGAWQSDAFVISTGKTGEEILNFFLHDYRPTPIVAPWNGGSGFYDGDDITGREAIRTGASERLASYREVINQVVSFPELPSISHLTVHEMVEQILLETAGLSDKDSEKKREIAIAVQNYLTRFQDPSALVNKTVDELEKLREEVSKQDKENAKVLADLLQRVKKLRTVVKKAGRAAGKDVIVQACRNRLDDQTVEWIDAALVLSESNSESPLLGAGGIDGHFEFTKNFMARLQEALPELSEKVLRERKKKTDSGEATNS
jgi:CRISPR-associated protein Csx17